MREGAQEKGAFRAQVDFARARTRRALGAMHLRANVLVANDVRSALLHNNTRARLTTELAAKRVSRCEDVSRETKQHSRKLRHIFQGAH